MSPNATHDRSAPGRLARLAVAACLFSGIAVAQTDGAPL
jgi:hypothetical protein